MYIAYQAKKAETTTNLKEESQKAMTKGKLRLEERALFRKTLAENLVAHWAAFSTSKTLAQKEKAAAVELVTRAAELLLELVQPAFVQPRCCLQRCAAMMQNRCRLP